MNEQLDADSTPIARTRNVDNHMFSVAQGSRPPATFRLQVFTAPGLRPVAVAIQTSGEGMSLTNRAERYAEAVWTRHFPNDPEPPIWIQRQILPGVFGAFTQVTFTVSSPHTLSAPRWRPLTTEALTSLVGVPVDADRGDGYIARVEEPEPRMIYAVTRVAALPRPQPFRATSCMPAGTSAWRRWARQLIPRHGGRDCCWYHQGDWHRVSAAAVRLVTQAQQDGLDVKDIDVHVYGQAMHEGMSGWELEALGTLASLGDGIALEENDDGDEVYINGQHRAQAMLDAGVRDTVVLRWEQPANHTG